MTDEQSNGNAAAAVAKEASADGETQSSQRTESAARLARPLIRLAKASGLATSFIDQLGTYTEISDEALIAVLKALNVDASTPQAVTQSIENLEASERAQLLPPTIVGVVGKQTRVELNCASDADVNVSITLEDGSAFTDFTVLPSFNSDRPVLTLGDDLPMGYHTLTATVVTPDDAAATPTAAVPGIRTGTATIINAPERIPVPEAVQERHRWGWMAQMYSVRSHESWGIGDYGDLQRMLADAARKTGADFMLINPIHAGAPIPPLEPSPYLPESRRFLNVTYIRPQDIPEYATLSAETRAKVDALHDSVAYRNEESTPMDINAAWEAKRPALRLIFDAGRSAEREQQFEAFKAAAGPDLDSFATWCLCFEVWGAPWGENRWFFEKTIDDPAVRELVAAHYDLFEFNRWLQWIAAEQVTAAQQTATESGMALGLMQDMAVGVHGLGADAWANPERFATGGVTVGCPPDFYNQQGQDWGQPPFNPRYLEATGYRVYREMVHSMYEHAGAVRIDHMLGLFRLWWIPQGLGARNGAYVMYNHEAMLGVLAIEATRAGGMVVGEDLGTVPDYVRQILAERGVLGTDVEWFSRENDSPNAGDPYKGPEEYRKQALASVTTHDLPPTAGYLTFEHVKLREQLHLLSEPVEEFAASALAERTAMMNRLVESGYISQSVADDVPAHIQEIVEAMHAMLTDTPSLLLQAALVDGVGETRSQNQPGTSSEYSNWRVPLADEDGHVVLSNEVFDLPRVQSLAAVMRGERQ
ncbi:4-alpha-glucanotransferase [Bifidobacterium saguini DSM 23967]|uniref:4-alpha-glucanotransferase n=2 Tax=Bifidobacterium saguini TaxID=762210 RepID=A0A087DBH7_9BIFI|nr:4-alpha-glucanotransferase [Bifidobacterium saguini]KFI92877.1 4-alpha-glucanotransferase [Bifidobacterium saguini DSM 23967]QTB91866.1 4-alpha-glucanotransferase [Bifidobacterium saguini]